MKGKTARTLVQAMVVAITSYIMISFFPESGRAGSNFRPEAARVCTICDHCKDEDRTMEILEGNTTVAETHSGSISTTFNLYNWYSIAVRGPNAGRGISFEGRDICTFGGTVKGMIPDSMTWLQVHDDVGGYAFKIDITGGTAALIDARIHNVEDGYKPRETPYYGNSGTMNVTGTYMTKIRDDCIENDGFMPGRIEDCLFDGVFVFYSEQEQSHLPAPIISIGPEEEQYVHISKVYVRTDMTNAPGSIHRYTAGHWFKLMPRDKGAILHKLKIDNSVFAISVLPKNKFGNTDWSRTAFPAGTLWSGENYILWLGPGEFGGKVPSGVKFLQGQEARNKWEKVRRDWATAHGYLPSQITATAGEYQVDLEWSTASNAVSYTIRRSNSRGGPYEVVTSNLKANSYIDKGLTSNTSYYYIVEAIDNCGVGQNTSELRASIGIPDKP